MTKLGNEGPSGDGPSFPDLIQPLRRLHDRVRDAVIEATERQKLDELADIRRDDEGDTIYAIDVVSEDLLLELFGGLSRDHSFVLIAEGLRGPMVFPRGSSESDAAWRIIVDPIDGTRGLMYQKRGAWILTGVAPNRGEGTSLEDIVLAVQTEIPLIKQHLSDQMWAIKGQGALAERYNRLTGERTPLHLRPSRSDTIAHGFSTISRFFPGAREVLAAIDDEIAMGALGPVTPGKAHCFEDQYISSGGQLHELMAGKDRFIADLRPMMNQSGICCHPYDVCTALIAIELGVLVTDVFGQPLNPPLNLEADVAWAGYANEQIRRQVEPLLQAALRNRGLIWKI
jgi:fructose-1,6-bisphosphatase/inositol monophosphatase family enzyme